MRSLFQTTLRHSKYFIPFLLLSPHNRVTCETNQEPKYYSFLSNVRVDSLKSQYPNLIILDQSKVEHILTFLRDKNTDTKNFRRYADRLVGILFEHALSLHDKVSTQRESPIGTYTSVELANQDSDICVVSIMRAGNAFLPQVFQILPGVTVGQLLIQRNEDTAISSHYYTKLPINIQNKKVYLVDPMLGTGGSACLAIKILKEHKVEEKNIIFVNIVGCEEGLKKLFQQYPGIKVVTAQIDPELLLGNKYLAPGLGDFGDRYFGTN